jgi:hypothetical protein
MELDPQSKTTADVTPEPAPASVFGKAAASLERAAAARTTAGEFQSAASEFQSDAGAQRIPANDISNSVIRRVEPAESESSLPIPAGPLRRSHQEVGRQSLWKRIKMKARGQDDVADRAEVSSQLKAINSRIDEFDEEAKLRFDALSVRLDEVWECEEQLSHLVELQDKVDQISRTQAESSDALRNLARRILLLTGCVVVLAGASAAAVVAYFR